MISRFPAWIFFVFGIVLSCSEDKDISLPDTWQAFIICEGNFGSNNSRITLLDTLMADTTFRNAYEAANNSGLGDYAHDMVISGTIGYIAVTGSNRVQKVDIHTMESLGKISGVSSPRHIVTDGTTLWISSYTDSSVLAYDLASSTVSTTYRLSHPGDELALIGGYVFAGNSTGGDSAISSIHLSDGMIERIVIGLNPVSVAAFPRRNELYVACRGSSVQTGYVAVVDVNTKSVVSTFSSGDRPVMVRVSDPYVSWIRNENGLISVTDVETGETTDSDGGNYYSIGFGGSDLFALDARDFLGFGQITWFTPMLDSKRVFSTDTSPSSIVFIP